MARHGPTCGLIVRYSGDNVYWPYDSKFSMPLTFDGDEPSMDWSYTLLVLSRNHVWMGTGEYGWGLRMLADLLARPDANRPWIDEADAAALAVVAETR
ncbi:hypothetical protein [Enterovirga sp. CN4-39]|uniref:hypothetical protein n=1 Tax=Enterovirga sp. CN4-39 TaxID=3400910 RepID=UPI003C000D20